MAPILLRAVNTADCGFNRAALRPAYPIKRPRARREHRHPKTSKPGKSLPLDPLENTIGSRRIDAAGQGRFRDDPAVPDRFDKLVLGHDPAAVGDEKGEHVEDRRPDDDRPVCLHEFAPIGVERVVFEEIQYRRPVRLRGQDFLLCLQARIEREPVSFPLK